MCFNSLNIHLLRVCRVRGEVPPQTFFSLSPKDEAYNADHLSHVCLLGFVSVLGQGPRPNTLLWAIAPTVSISRILQMKNNNYVLCGGG